MRALSRLICLHSQAPNRFGQGCVYLDGLSTSIVLARQSAHTEGKKAVPKAGTSWKHSVPSGSEIRDTKRRTLLREAAHAFNSQGFHATSLDDLAQRLGVTKAALYHYFPSKKALLKACFDEVMEVGFANLVRATLEGSNGREKLRLALAGYLKDIIDELSVAVVIIEHNTLSAEDREAVIAERDRYERALRRLVREGIKDGSIVPCDPKLVVFTMLGAVNWVPRWYRNDGSWSTEQLADAMSAILDRAVSAQPSSGLARSLTGTNSAALSAVKRRTVKARKVK